MVRGARDLLESSWAKPEEGKGKGREGNSGVIDAWVVSESIGPRTLMSTLFF